MLPKQYKYSWDKDMGKLSRERIVRHCRESGITYEEFALRFVSSSQVQSKRYSCSDFAGMTDQQWGEYLRRFAKWIVKQLAKTSRVEMIDLILYLNILDDVNKT